MWQLRQRPPMQQRFVPSLLDRLLPLRAQNQDNDPANQNLILPDGTLAWDVDAERRSVRRDVEDLLNTAIAPQLADILPQALSGSILNYGLHELSMLSATEGAEHRALCQSIHTAIETFEPRLLVHEVNLVASPRNRWLLQVQIIADLRLEPVVQRLVFDATLPLMTRHFEVREMPADAR